MHVQVNVPPWYWVSCYLCVSAANLSGRPGGAPERPFVRATSLLHSHFCNTETLQEAIIRSVRQWRGEGGWGFFFSSFFRAFNGSSSRSRGLDLSVHRVYHRIPPFPKCSSSTCIDHTPSDSPLLEKKVLLFYVSLLCHFVFAFVLHDIVLTCLKCKCDILTAGVLELQCMEAAAWPRKLTSSSMGDRWGTLASPTTRTVLSYCPARPDTDYWSTGLTCSDGTASCSTGAVFCLDMKSCPVSNLKTYWEYDLKKLSV